MVVIDHDGKTMSGVSQPRPERGSAEGRTAGHHAWDAIAGEGRPDPVLPIFKVYFEVDAKDAKGNPVAIVAEGTMHNVALPNRWITGTWTQTSGGKTVKSEFKIARQ